MIKKMITAYILIMIIVPLMLFVMLFMTQDTKEVTELKFAEAVNVPVWIVKQAYDRYGDDYVERLAQLGDRVGFNWKRVNSSMINALSGQTVSEAMVNIKKKTSTYSLYKALDQMYGSITHFPVPEEVWIVKKYYDGKLISEEETKHRKYNYRLFDDFAEERNYKEKRPHYGNDLVADRGIPLVSMTDGVITRFGWNEHGGWRVGVETKEGAYFYYAHMDHYAKGLYQGKFIEAGDLIGYIGDSGYGPEGTTGMFITHLHLQIGVIIDDKQPDYMWMDPYSPLRLSQDNIKVIEHVSEIHKKSKTGKDKKNKGTEDLEETEIEKEGEESEISTSNDS